MILAHTVDEVCKHIMYTRAPPNDEVGLSSFGATVTTTAHVHGD
jgi:hypothetical protein